MTHFSNFINSRTSMYLHQPTFPHLPPTTLRAERYSWKLVMSVYLRAGLPPLPALRRLAAADRVIMLHYMTALVKVCFLLSDLLFVLDQ